MLRELDKQSRKVGLKTSLAKINMTNRYQDIKTVNGEELEWVREYIYFRQAQ